MRLNNKKYFKCITGKCILPVLLLLLFCAIICYLILNSKNIVVETTNPVVSAGVVPHHLLAEELINDFFTYISEQKKPETIVLLSPDHFDSANILKYNFATLEYQDLSAKENAETGFHGLEIDNGLITELCSQNKIALSNSAVGSDHGITNLMPFIKEYLPKSKVVPIIISADTSLEETEQLVDSIDSFSSSKTIIIASVDFSHYLISSAAAFHDIKSIRTLLDFRKDDFKDVEVDCWQALYIARAFAHLRDKELYNIIGYKDSTDFLKGKDIEETTSYFSVVFQEKAAQEPVLSGAEGQMSRYKDITETKTILFVGDIMLDRGVEYLMRKNSVFYPFQKIAQFLKGIDIVFGNLEGPIVENPPHFPDASLRFAFSPDVLKGLSFAKFNLLSLANNHTLNMAQSGLAETRAFLKDAGINFLGDPILCGPDFGFEENGIQFLSINKTFPFNCSQDDIQKNVKAVRAQHADDFLIVILHWGEEYQIKHSSAQQGLAYCLIDAGADMVIGSHAHVVQDIELYKDKLIFYSLGNFIFDQYFSEDTEQGLAIGMELWPDKLIYRLFPIQSRLGQPALMNQDAAKGFLQGLSQRSSQELSESIKTGIIETKR